MKKEDVGSSDGQGYQLLGVAFLPAPGYTYPAFLFKYLALKWSFIHIIYIHMYV